MTVIARLKCLGTEKMANMMQQKTFQNIFNEVIKCLPSEWGIVVIYLEYGDNAYSYAFYVKVNGKYINGFDIPGSSEKQIYDSFKKIDRIILADRKASKDLLWSNMTMVVSADGTMHADYDYTDLSEGAYKYKKKWKEKYLSE